MNRKSARALIGAAWAGLALTGCYSPTATVQADAMTEEDRATYLILTDQLDRVRNVLKKPARVCLGLLPDGSSGGLAPVPTYIVDRLTAEQAAIEPRLDLTADIECLAYYVQNKGYFTPEASDVLAYAGALGYDNHCGDWIGGLYDQGSLNRSVNYDVEVDGGVARLTGGEDCSPIYWYRS